MNENDARQFFDEWEQCSPRELKEVIDQAIRDRGGNRLSPLKLRLLMKSIWEEIIEDVRFEVEMKISDSLEDDYEEGRRTTEPTDDEIEGLAYPKVSEALRELTKVDLLRRVECQLWNGNLDEILSKSDDEIVAEEKADKDARTALQALPEEEYSKIIQEMAEQAKSNFNMELKVGEPIYVYVLRHPDGTPIYVGKGTGERANSHIDRARQSTESSPLLDEIRRVVKTGREVLVDIVEYFDEESGALELEKRLIEEIGQKSKGKGPLLNILSSGATHYALAAAQESDGTENEDLDALAEPYVQELEKLGWHVVVESSGIFLHDYFKNGKIKKAPTVYIQKFDDCSVRPWYCSAPSLKRAKSHAKVKNAVKFLLEIGRLHAPAK